MRKRGYILIVLVLALSACSSPNYCFLDMNTYFKVNLCKMVFNNSSEKYEEQSFSSTLRIRGLDNDSVLYNWQSLSSFSLPLRKLDTLSVFLVEQMYVESGDTLFAEDTLWIRHDNELEFVSLECGCASIYNVHGVAYSVNKIDSVKMMNGVVDRSKPDNLKIFVKK